MRRKPTQPALFSHLSSATLNRPILPAKYTMGGVKPVSISSKKKQAGSGETREPGFPATQQYCKSQKSIFAGM
jgi:hypothetical protein